MTERIFDTQIISAPSDEAALATISRENRYVVIERGELPGQYKVTRIPPRQSPQKPQESAA